MRRPFARLAAALAVVGSALLAYGAVGNGDIVATSPVTVVTVTSPMGMGSGTATLENTTASTTYSVLVGSDATCDPDVTFNVMGGNPIASFAPNSSRAVAIGCPARGSAAMERCLLHATNNSNGTPLVDFMALCLYGDPPSLSPSQTSIDFGTLDVGTFVDRTLSLTNDGSGSAIRRIYVASSDLDGNFEFTTPCNPDAAYCDIALTSEVPPGSSFDVGVRCRPQAAGTHTANVYVGTDTFQLLSLGVTLSCTGAATTQPALAVNPTTITIPSGVEVDSATANVSVHLSNAGGGVLQIKDVRVVDVDTSSSDDWSYAAHGACSGQIASCMLDGGETIDIDLTFNPSQIGSRRAALLVSYHDTLDRTLEVPLDASGRGATVRRLDSDLPLAFGTVPVGVTSTLDITLVNDGNRDASIDVALDPDPSPGFAVMPSTNVAVTPGMPRTISVECTPQAEGSASTTVTVSSPDLAAALEIPATCEGTTDPLYAVPSALALGEVRTNAVPRTVTVQLVSATAPSQLNLAGAPVLEQTNPEITLGPYSSTATPATFDVTLAPQTAGAVNAIIDVETTAGQTLHIPLSASAVTAALIVADALDLGTFCVDQPTTSSNLALLSTGTATIALDPPTLGMSPSPFALSLTTPDTYPHMLAPGASAVVAVTPQRQRVATTVSDALTWHTDVDGMTAAPTALTARFIDSGGAIAPPALNFGAVTPHLYTANGQRVVIQNCNATPLVLDPPLIKTPFSIDSPSFPTMLNPNESVAFSVGFHPTRVGTVTDTLRITSPQLPDSPLQVTLVGTGAKPESPPPDAGVGSESPGETSFYSCACTSSQKPLGGFPIVLAVAALLVRRRRSTYASARWGGRAHAGGGSQPRSCSARRPVRLR